MEAKEKVNSCGWKECEKPFHEGRKNVKISECQKGKAGVGWELSSCSLLLQGVQSVMREARAHIN